MLQFNYWPACYSKILIICPEQPHACRSLGQAQHLRYVDARQQCTRDGVPATLERLTGMLPELLLQELQAHDAWYMLCQLLEASCPALPSLCTCNAACWQCAIQTFRRCVHFCMLGLKLHMLICWLSYYLSSCSKQTSIPHFSVGITSSAAPWPRYRQHMMRQSRTAAERADLRTAQQAFLREAEQALVQSAASEADRAKASEQAVQQTAKVQQLHAVLGAMREDRQAKAAVEQELREAQLQVCSHCHTLC